MAKRRKTPEEEEREIFEEPEFDEREFLVSEIKKAKGIIFIFSVALILGLISGYLQVYVSVYMGVILGFGFLLILKPILGKLHAEFKDKKTWFYAITMFLLIWFLGWTVALNPPLNDVSPPQIRNVEVYNGTAWVVIYTYSHGVYDKNIDKLKWGNKISVRAFVSDNVGVDQVKINGHLAKRINGYYVAYNITNSGRITVEAWDVNYVNSPEPQDHYSKVEITVPMGKQP